MRSWEQRKLDKAAEQAATEHGPDSPEAAAAREAAAAAPKSFREAIAAANEKAARKAAARDAAARDAAQAAEAAAADPAADAKAARKAARKADNKAAVSFVSLGVRVVRDRVQVYIIHNDLGPLAGASAQIVGETSKHRVGGALVTGAVVGPAGLLVGATKKGSATAMIAFADGSTHQHRIDKMNIPGAHREVAKFNALAAAATKEQDTPQADGASRLRRLGELHDSGLISDGEYAAKRADILLSL